MSIIIISLILLLFSVILLSLFALIFFIANVFKYNSSSYHKITHKRYLELKKDEDSFGNYSTYKKLKILEKNNAKFLFSLHVPCNNDKSVEIDILIINPNGLFVIDRKIYKGWIYGDENSKYWKRSLTQDQCIATKKEFFDNPIIQNQIHINYLSEILNSNNIPIYSLIVFPDNAEFVTSLTHIQDVSVINERDLNYTIKLMLMDNRKILNEKDIEKIYNMLYPLTQDIKEN